MELYDRIDKLATEIDHLDRVLDVDEVGEAEVELALVVAKRVRRESTFLVRELAQKRDSYQP